jgi:excinuclease UvrABC helicase subunit UvrB
VGKKFQLESSFSPMGDQPQAIKTLVNGVNAGEKFQTLLGRASLIMPSSHYTVALQGFYWVP